MSPASGCQDPRCAAERAALEADLGCLLDERVAAHRAATSRWLRSAARCFGAASGAALAVVLLRGVGLPQGHVGGVAALGATLGALTAAATLRGARPA